MNYTSETNPVPHVRARRLATTGHLQAIVRCPKCSELHRHLGLGVRRGPCGITYVVQTPRIAAPRLVRVALAEAGR
ncbi:hypothetical protein AB0O91_21935 [Kitasatospora sp. NPDC089797]|uniref:hypothetical protein n=1 Tax=Kitasatospora sp. NPDC089797 TaxID=3155298 RepID=UPI00342BC259